MTAQRFGNWFTFRKAVLLFGKPGDERSPAAVYRYASLNDGDPFWEMRR